MTMLFVGSSHVGALKAGYDSLDPATRFEAKFVAAPAADIAFTSVEQDALRPAPVSGLTPGGLFFFFPEAGAVFHKLYLEEKRPFEDVAASFAVTAKADEVPLAGVTAIFYVGGTSPYDFPRLGETSDLVAPKLRGFALEHQAGSRYALFPQVTAIRARFPDIRQYLVGTPLRRRSPQLTGPVDRACMLHKRDLVARQLSRSIFDEVFMPSADLLDDDLMGTRAEYFINGRQQAETFQGGRPTRSDDRHANGDYGLQIIERFVRPRLNPPG